MLRLSPQETDAVNRLAKDMKATRPQYLRFCLRDRALKDLPPDKATALKQEETTLIPPKILFSPQEFV